jgi:hypothetical protein
MAEDQSPETPIPEPETPPEEPAVIARPEGRNRKLLLILAVAMLGGTIAGVGGTMVISSLFKEKPQTITVSAPPPVEHHVEAPAPDPKQEALIKDLKEEKARLEAQLKQQADARRHETPTKVEEPPKAETAPPPPPKVIYRTVNSKDKPKVSEDCTISEKVDGVGDRLKNCIQDFNNATR